jgi:predicted transcriptional regulator
MTTREAIDKILSRRKSGIGVTSFEVSDMLGIPNKTARNTLALYFKKGTPRKCKATKKLVHAYTA